MARITRVVAEHYPHHITQRGNRGQDTFFCDNDYQFLSGDVSDKQCALLQRHKRTGRPLGSERFIVQLENALSRMLTPQKGGRPRKE
jgi:hypothetical protein